MRTGTKDLLQFEKGAGVHARSAEIYNQLLKKLGISDKYEPIGSRG